MVGGIGSRALNKLTDLTIRAFVRDAKAGKNATTKLADGGGLYLTITPAGTPVWRVKYRFNGKERVFSAGAYPALTLEAARAQREKVKSLLREGRDPVQSRRVDRENAMADSGATFNSVAADWLTKQQAQWSPVHYEKSSRAFERDVLPRIGKLPVKDITPQIVASVVEAIVKRGVRETAAKVLQHINAVFRFAQARGLRRDNPAEPVPEILPPKKPAGRMPAILTWEGLGDVLRRAEAAHLSPAVRMAHRLCAFSVARIGNVVEADWQEFDLESQVATWIIPRAKMKSRDRHHDHKIVLAPCIAAELQVWRSTVGGRGPVFPSPQGGKRISRESLEKVYRVTLGLARKHSPHGWRSAFSTLAKDHDFERDVVELTLDHVHDTNVVRAYDRGERLQQRIKLMYWWADHLRAAQAGGQPNALAQRIAVYRVRALPARSRTVRPDRLNRAAA
jgi:integrase